MDRAMLWEFPGGKIRRRETAAECVVREVREELEIRVCPISVRPPVRHRYADRTIELTPVLCRHAGGRLRLREHAAAAWPAPRDLSGLSWTAADIPVVRWAATLRACVISTRKTPRGGARPTVPGFL